METVSAAGAAAGETPAASTNIHELLADFQGRLPPTRASALYHAGLAVVALVMVLLPAIYVTLIVLTAYGVYYHLAHNTWILMGGGGGLGRVIGYFGPLIIGLILVLFMVKPLFARRPPRPRNVALTPATEPRLFSFLERICELVNAPAPRQVEVDCQVNASASFRRGLWSFAGSDLTLTIGLPLAAGLNARQFAGVLAHEFGHFTQGAGMRLTYLIRSVSLWFARVVYQRDRWDLELERTAKTVDIRVAVILHAARGVVWFTRRILWALMHVGNAVSCFMLRQMEFDADTYKAKLAGSDTFGQTVHRLHQLNAATQVTFHNLRESWKSRRLADDLPAFIVGTADQFPAELRRQIAEATTKEATAPFDTHPSNADRIRAAEALAAAGVFRSAAPASALFQSFSELCRHVSRHCYEKEHELPVGNQNLIPTRDLLRESGAEQEVYHELELWTGEVDLTHQALELDAECLHRPPESAASIDALIHARGEMARLQSEAIRATQQYAAAETRYRNATNAWALLRAGFSIEAREFDLAHGTPNAALAAQVEQQNRSQAASNTLAKFAAAMKRRLTAALQWLQSPAAETTLPDAATLRAEAARLLPVLSATAATVPSLVTLAREFVPLQLLLANRANHAEPAKVDAAVQESVQRIQVLLDTIRRPLKDVSYPFPHARGQITLEALIQPDDTPQHPLEELFSQCAACLDRLLPLQIKALAHLIRLAHRVEAVAAPP